jgi:predicted nucleic acid-binding Zn ribbon protein
LLTEERFPEALWVLEFVKNNFAKEVGWTPPASIAEEEREQSISRDELENLQLLETLNI